MEETFLLCYGPSNKRSNLTSTECAKRHPTPRTAMGIAWPGADRARASAVTRVACGPCNVDRTSCYITLRHASVIEAGML